MTDQRIDRNDPLENADKSYGKFEKDNDGYTQYIPKKDRLDELNYHYYEEIVGAENDYAPYFNEVADNYEAYYGKNIDVRWSDNPVLQLPIVNRSIEQMVSWYILQIMRHTPVVSFKPYHDEEYTVPVPVQPVPGAVPMGTVAEKKMSGEDLASSYERGFDKLLREKCGFRTWLSAVMKESHVAGRSYTKIHYRKDPRMISVPGIKTNASGIVSGFYEADSMIQRDEASRFERIPITSILTPIDQQDPQNSDWIAEKIVMSNTELRNRFASGAFPLVTSKEFEELLKLNTATYRTDAEKRIAGQSDKSVTLVTRRHILYMVWFDLPIRIDGKLNLVPVCGLYHREAQKFLCIYKNPYAHKERPFALFIEGDEEDNEFGVSVVGKIKGHAALMAMMLHIDIQNAVQSVNVNWFADPNCPGYATLVNEEDYPGRVIPRRSPGEIEVVPMGRSHGGLQQQYGVVNEDLRQTLNISIYEEGMHVPGRTAAASIKQIMDAGYQKPMKNMLALSDFIARMLRMWLEVKRQFEPLGETFAHVNEDTKQIMEAVIRYPTGVPLDMFRISLTAADEFMSKDEDSEERIMIYNLVTQNNQTLASMIGGLVDLGAPPSIVAALGDMANAQIDALKYVIEATRKDSDRFVLNKEIIANIISEREAAAQMQAQQAQQEAMQPPPEEGEDVEEGEGEEESPEAAAGEQPMAADGGAPAGPPEQLPQ